MTLKATLAIGAACAGAWLALGPLAAAEPPLPTLPQATVTVTRTVEGTYQGWTARKWAAHTARARRDANEQHKDSEARGRTIHRLQGDLERRFQPDVTTALAIARIVYGVDQTARAKCESHFNPYAVEGHGPLGLLQFKPSTWATTPYAGLSIWDPYAQALAGGWMVAKAGRSSEWACRL